MASLNTPSTSSPDSKVAPVKPGDRTFVEKARAAARKGALLLVKEQDLLTKFRIVQKEPPSLLTIMKLDNKTVTENLIRKKDYYITLENEGFKYHKISALQESGNYLFKFGRKRPEMFSEGLVFIERQCYFVTLEDLERGVVRKSRKVPLKSGSISYDDFINGTIYPNTNSKVEPSSEQSSNVEGGPETIVAANETGQSGQEGKTVSDIPTERLGTQANQLKSGSNNDPWLAELAEANLAFSKQERELHNFLSAKEEEEWED